MVEAVIKSFRRINILVNNAGILYPSHARFSGESSSFVEHDEVVVQWNIVRYAIARSQAVTTAGVARLQGRSYAATNGFFICPAEEIDVDPSQDGDAVAVSRLGRFHGPDGVLVGVEAIDPTSSKRSSMMASSLPQE